MVTAVVIPVEGPCTIEEVGDLRWYQEKLGGYIEAVTIRTILTDSGMTDVNCTVFVNEEGKLHGLPTNHRATDLCAVEIGGWIRDVIVGAAVVTGPADYEGETTSCPNDVVAIIREWGWL